MDVQIKSFHIRNEADEQSLNNFLRNKVIRHWSTSYSPASSGALGALSDALTGGQAGHTTEGGTWNVFLAYEERMNSAQTNGRNERRDKPERNPRERSPQNGERTQDRNSDRAQQPKREPKAKDMTPREDYVPNVPEADLPLFEAVRKWRNARARDAKVKPFAFFNNARLEELVKAKPSGEEGLRTLLPEMEPELFDRYKNELLGFLGGAMTVPAEAAASLG